MRLAGWALVFAGCSHQPRPGESPAEVCVAANHQKRVTVSGYFVAPNVTTGCAETCSMYLSPSSSAREGVWATFKVGSEANTMQPIVMKDSFRGEVRRLRATDFRVRDGAGRVAIAGEVIRVSGELWAPTAGRCELRVDAVEVVR